MRKPLGQLFVSIVLSVIGSFVLLLILPQIGMKHNAGSPIEAGVVIAIVILVLFYAMGAVQSFIANRRFEAIPSGPREEGTVKWFNSTKGFGFITREDGEDVFVHYRSIRSKNRYLLREGAVVTYVLGRSGKGPQAEDVELED
jgi:cold shock protein